jgi:Fibronectin type III domain
MPNPLKHILPLLIVLTSWKGVAQVFPIQSTLQITPPYSLSLADYVAPGTERLALNVYLADVNRPELSVRFRLRVEGIGIRIETKPEFLLDPVIINGGVPLRLIGTDLAPYFDPRNLNFSGITQREYEQKGALPEGLYQITFEALEYNRGVKISNAATVMAWLVLNDPPLINLPRDNEKLRVQSPQQVVFQWTPRHTGSPNAAFTTEYEFKLVEVWPATRNANDAVLTSPAIFETTTQASTLVYGPAETPLEPGRRYAFRIKAKSIVGVDELNLFKNNGYSQVSTFVYGDACTLPTGIQTEVISSSRINVQWETQENHTSYTVNYRVANTPNAVWYSNTSTLNDIDINSLKPGTAYEYQVAASCGFYESTFSPVATFTTKEAPAVNYSCGLPLQPFNLDPNSLVASLKTSDVVYTGDFAVELTKVTGSNGTFSGEGIVVMPFMNNVKVKVVFANILVNKDIRMVKGYMDVKGVVIDVVPDEVTAMMDKLDESLDKIEEGLDKAEEIVEKVDEVLAQVEQVKNELMSYLPYAYVQKIKDSQAAVVSAKEALKTAATPEAEAVAKTQLKEARGQLKEATGQALEYYAKTIKEFLKLFREVIVQLQKDVSGSIKNLQQQQSETGPQFTQAREGVLAERNVKSIGAEASGESDKTYALIGGNEGDVVGESDLEELRKDPKFKEYLDRASQYAKVIVLLQANEAIIKLVDKVTNDDKALKNYLNIVKEKLTQEGDAIKLAIKEGKIDSELRDKIVRVLEDSLFQEYVNAEK